tara:strand:- start:1537 stop:1758 length:222 start_codon:yes stop_codon:yes gene_type:complete
VNLQYIELELDWPSELKVLDLRTYILSQLINYGKPLRWAITSLTPHSAKSIQKISIEAVLIIEGDRTNDINTI